MILSATLHQQHSHVSPSGQTPAASRADDYLIVDKVKLKSNPSIAPPCPTFVERVFYELLIGADGGQLARKGSSDMAWLVVIDCLLCDDGL